MGPVKIARAGQIGAFAMAFGLCLLAAGGARAQEHEQPPRQSWSFSGPFGKFDRGQLQRGFKVYREVCSNCHALSLVSFRNLAEEGGPGYDEDQAKTVAESYQIADFNDKGEQIQRPGRLSDRFPKPFPNEDAARAANGGAYPPDMSTLAKARTYERGFPLFLLDAFTQFQEQGQDYIHAVLVGYEEPPAGHKPAKEGLHYNRYFPGHWIAMPQPIQDGQVEYTDGTPATVDQYGKDIAAFLTWAAEPHMVERKRLGFVVMIFLIVFAGLVYYTKKRVWAGLRHQMA